MRPPICLASQLRESRETFWEVLVQGSRAYTWYWGGGAGGACTSPTPRRTSPVGGEGRGAGLAVEDEDIGGTISGVSCLRLWRKKIDAGGTATPD